jgi:hypothetical protein
LTLHIGDICFSLWFLTHPLPTILKKPPKNPGYIAEEKASHNFKGVAYCWLFLKSLESLVLEIIYKL